MVQGWGSVPSETKKGAPSVSYDAEYYRNLFDTSSQQAVDVRMALVARENCAKTGLALSFCRDEIESGQKVVILDVDNSAKSTVDYVYPDKENILCKPLLDENDESIFNDDNTINYVALTDKINWYVNMIAEQADDIGAVIFDGGSTFLKWCEHAMTHVLQHRTKNPVNPENPTTTKQHIDKIELQTIVASILESKSYPMHTKTISNPISHARMNGGAPESPFAPPTCCPTLACPLSPHNASMDARASIQARTVPMPEDKFSPLKPAAAPCVHAAPQCLDTTHGRFLKTQMCL